MLPPFILWPCIAGLILLAYGLFAVRRELAKASRLDKLIVLGPVFLAASIAVFGAEHLARPQVLVQTVPAWMPGRLFWVYFVGVALLAAAVSMVLRKYVRLSAALLGVMFFLFVLMVHLPRVTANPKDRFAWAVAFRELAFAGGAWALAGWPAAVVSRFLVAIPLIFFGVEHLLHPEFAPGVPLPKLTPAWVPFPVVWGYITGAVLCAGGLRLLASKRSRSAVAWVGLVLTLLTLFLYLPIQVMARQPSAMLEAMNYVADTLLFAGAVLCVAKTLPGGRWLPSLSSR
jgi:uncharacterized membrane protein